MIGDVYKVRALDMTNGAARGDTAERASRIVFVILIDILIWVVWMVLVEIDRNLKRHIVTYSQSDSGWGPPFHVSHVPTR
jgi:hypothetical protein